MHVKFHSFLVNSDKSTNTAITLNKISSYEVFYRFIDFLMTYLYKIDFYDQQTDALYSAKLLYRDHWYKLRKKGGSKTEPWGTLQSTTIKSELYPMVETNSLRSDK